MIGVELAIVLALIVFNGILALSELAVVSARRSRLQLLAEAGNAGAKAALALAAQPGRFLSTVQIGITLVGILAGAFGGASIADRFGDWLETFGLSMRTADTIAFGLVIAFITYLSLIIGELVPKQVALRDPERIAVAVARPMALLARLASPIVYLLDISSKAGLWLLRVRATRETGVTDEEIKLLIAEATRTGVVEPQEREMISGVMRLGDRSVRAIMTPRRDVEWIDIDAEPAEIRRRVRESRHTLLLAGRGTIDELAGAIGVKDVLDAYLDGREADIASLVKPVPAVPDSTEALEAIRILKRSPMRLAIVVDEHGTLEGVVSPDDFLEAIAGDFADARDGDRPRATRREDGTWLIDGLFAIDELAETLSLPLPEDRDYHTAAGFMLALLRRMPEEGSIVEWDGWRFEVIDMDGRRVDKLLAKRSGN